MESDHMTTRVALDKHSQHPLRQLQRRRTIRLLHALRALLHPSFNASRWTVSKVICKVFRVNTEDFAIACTIRHQLQWVPCCHLILLSGRPFIRVIQIFDILSFVLCLVLAVCNH